MKEQPVTAKQRTKKALMLLSFTVSLFALFLCAVVASNWLKFSSYRSLAQELNQTLGGGYKISYKWNCGIETTNCPSSRIILETNNSGEQSVNAELDRIVGVLKEKGLKLNSMGECYEADQYGYCRAEFKDVATRLVITVSVRPKVNFIEIQS